MSPTMGGHPLPAQPQHVADDQPKLSELVSGIVTDAQRLFCQQVEMARAEIIQDIRRTKLAVRYIGIGAAITTLGAIHLTIATVYLLNSLAFGLQLWACWAIVGGVAAVGGVLTVYLGTRVLARTSQYSNKALSTLTENVSWISNPQK